MHYKKRKVMKWKNNGYIILSLAVMPFFSRAYIYEIKIVSSKDKQTLILGLSDFHDKTDPSNLEQRSFLLSLFDAIHDKSTAKILVEDLSSANIYGAMGCNQFLLASNQGILASLTKQCQQLHLDVDNLEYRYSRVIALGPMLSRIDENPFRFAPACSIRIAALLKEVEIMMNRIQHFKDMHELEQWYDQCCSVVIHKLQELQWHKVPDASCAAYLEKAYTQKNRMNFLKHLLTFDSSLFDCALLHSIVTAHNKNMIIVIAGGTHIQRSFEQLTKIGYKQTYATTVNFKRDYDLNRNIGSPVMPGGYCVKPHPINLEILKNYIK